MFISSPSFPTIKFGIFNLIISHLASKYICDVIIFLSTYFDDNCIILSHPIWALSSPTNFEVSQKMAELSSKKLI